MQHSAFNILLPKKPPQGSHQTAPQRLSSFLSLFLMRKDFLSDKERSLAGCS